MSSELIAIITAAIALAGLNLITTERLGGRITGVEERLDARITEVEERLGARITVVEERLGTRVDRLGARVTIVEERLAEVRQETARLSGLLEGLELAERLPPNT